MIIIGDNLDIMKTLPDGCVNLIVTSPPYADARRDNTRAWIRPEDYVEWFLPRADEMYRVLADDGSFVLNIKEKVMNGERHTYVMELVLALRKRRWLWTEEYIWYKTNAMPGRWSTRFRDAWEHLYQFTKSHKFKMNQSEVMIPSKETSEERRKHKASSSSEIRQETQTGSGFGITRKNAVRDTIYPDNVLSGGSAANSKSVHSATFPEYLPEFFIKLFTDERDLVLDPFAGSGTTCRVAERLNRNAIGIDIIDPVTL